MWEDARNKSGGRWLLNFEKKDRSTVLDNCWMETVYYKDCTFKVVAVVYASYHCFVADVFDW